MRTAFVAPSASTAMSSASFTHALARASSNDSRSTRPAVPLARTITVSFVEVAPSTTNELKEEATAPTKAFLISLGVSSASVLRTASMVAISGSSIAAPFAMPPITKPSPSITTCLAKVSVVMIAFAASSPSDSEDPNEDASPPTPSRAESRGNGMPMSPVWQSKTSSEAHESDVATACVRVRAAFSPGSPVAALAFPDVKSTALITPWVSLRCCLLN